MHVEQVLGDVRPEERCRCREDRAKDSTPAPGTGIRGFIRSVFGR
jgi:hypothetical protein